MLTFLVRFRSLHSKELLSYHPVVNNAGYVLGVEHVGDIKDEDVEGMFATNVLGLISMTQLLIKGTLECEIS